MAGKGKFARPSLRLAIYVRDRFTCVYCAAPADPLLVRSNGTHPELELDHLVPQTRGGGHDPANLMTCCHTCNDSKFKWDLDEFLEKRGDMDSDAVTRRVYLAKRRRLKRVRADARVLLRMLRLRDEARCPWCDTTCSGCFESLMTVDLLQMRRNDADTEGEDLQGEDGLLVQEEGRDPETAPARRKGREGDQRLHDGGPHRHVDEARGTGGSP